MVIGLGCLMVDGTHLAVRLVPGVACVACVA